MTSITNGYVLFVCTGNYYRSRFAEILFNAIASDYEVSLRSESRGLITRLITEDMGPLSPHAMNGLQNRSVPFKEHMRNPIQIKAADLINAYLVVALDEREHRPMMEDQFPEWADRVSYWNVADIHDASPDNALESLEQNIRALLAQLRPQTMNGVLR